MMNWTPAKFHACRFVLVSEVSKVPMRKATIVATNMCAVVSRFHEAYCKCGKGFRHHRIQGREGGATK
eukprot:277022-Prorocentrum_lima.AAC.1